ncbi:hypothetical protein Taro_030358 [Colocasia esculenta]|uniref:Uncharacterized protein n=1 Tax=Colocasia esculenta TaxID=4460 RepID=A0A843VTU6_COLES|nr:hypothetical protein [Colocasia esculenta]
MSYVAFGLLKATGPMSPSHVQRVKCSGREHKPQFAPLLCASLISGELKLGSSVEAWEEVQTPFYERSVDTPLNGVDTSPQSQRQKAEELPRLCRHMSKSVSTRVADSRNKCTQVDTLSEQVDTGPSSQNSQFAELGQQVDTLSEQVSAFGSKEATGPMSPSGVRPAWLTRGDVAGRLHR